MDNKLFIARLQNIMRRQHVNQAELAQRSGIRASSISDYLTGKYKPKQDKIALIAKALFVSPAWLMGYDSADNNGIESARETSNIFPIQIKSFPLLGEIRCGVPSFAEQNFEAYITAGANIKADFCLRARGDSMIGARIYDGDIVFIRKQELVNDGEIAAVLIDDEATLKRVYYDKDANVLKLFAENPSYKTMIFANDELNRIRIMGKAVACQSDIK